MLKSLFICNKNVVSFSLKKTFVPKFFSDYKITFVNSDLENTNSKGDLYSETGFRYFFKKISDIIHRLYLSQKYLFTILYSTIFEF